MAIPEPKVSLIERAVSRLQDTRIEQERLWPDARSGRNGPRHAADDAFKDHRTKPRLQETILRKPARQTEVVEIDTDSLARRGFVVPGAQPNRTVNEFRTIKRPLLLNISGKIGRPVLNAQHIMITSALPGEGKTFCAVNLALSLASERDYSVLLVDADVARPSIADELRVKNCAGLMDALIDPAIDPSTLVLPTSIDTLSLLMSGCTHPKATEFLASMAMSRLVATLSASEPDRIIIFDSPPLLVTTESRALASHMGQIIMIVETGRTQHAAVKAALKVLDQASGVVSLLMNKSAAPRKGSIYRYGGYGYGYGDA